MNFEKRNFMGIELDVLVGHPEHDLLFIVSQVARHAGLKDPSNAVCNFRSSKRCTVKVPMADIMSLDYFQGAVPMAPNGRRYHDITTLMDEPNVYQMLLRSNSPQTEPFRKWVTEEVLPSIRKTGKYSAEESTNPIAQGIMNRLMSLEGIILKQGETLEALRQELSIEAPGAASKPLRPLRHQREIFFTPIGTVEPYCYIDKPDYGRDHFISDRGKYKINLTLENAEAQPLIDRIVAIHEADYAKRVTEFKKNPPQMPSGKKPLQPYQGDLPFIDNGDGTVTFKFVGWGSYEKDGGMIPIPLHVVDAFGEAIADVPNISGGSEGKVRFSIVPYGWNPTVGASVKLQLEGFMLTKLVEFGDGQGDWSGQEEVA
ncbi:BRO family, N-terminal domain [Pseudomonas sp. NFACC19-2]|nr:BRO family protein [Pseudomonas sp. NFACC19-2]SFW31821.1 BRO family, N-terminal domain [Pseudomonas sp. NFACC19-2]